MKWREGTIVFAAGIAYGGSEDQVIRRARFQRLEQQVFVAILIGGSTERDADAAETLKFVIGKKKVFCRTPRIVARRHAADEERFYLPLAGFEGAHDVNHVAAVVGNLHACGVKRIGQDGVESFERYGRCVAPEVHGSFERRGPGSQAGGVAARGFDSGVIVRLGDGANCVEAFGELPEAADARVPVAWIRGARQ